MPVNPALLAACLSASTSFASAGSERSAVQRGEVQPRHLLGEALEVGFGDVARVLFALLVVEDLDEVPPLVLLARGEAATCWVLKTSGSRVAVSIEWYSIFSLPVRTYFWMTDGSAPSVNSLQIGHSRSPKYCSVTGAFGSPSVLPCWGMPPISESDFRDRGVRLPSCAA